MHSIPWELLCDMQSGGVHFPLAAQWDDTLCPLPGKHITTRSADYRPSIASSDDLGDYNLLPINIDADQVII